MKDSESEELYQNTSLGVMRVTNLLVCKCGRVLIEKVLVDNGADEKVCPDCGTKKEAMDPLLDREGVPPKVKDFFEKR